MINSLDAVNFERKPALIMLEIRDVRVSTSMDSWIIKIKRLTIWKGSPTHIFEGLQSTSLSFKFSWGIV